MVMEHAWTDIDEGANSSVVFTRAVLADATLRRLFDAAFAHATVVATAGACNAMEWETALLRLAERVRLNSTAKLTSARALPCIRRAKELIDADPSSARLTLARLAAEVQLSRYQLLRAFARKLGLTPHA